MVYNIFILQRIISIYQRIDFSIDWLFFRFGQFLVDRFLYLKKYQHLRVLFTNPSARAGYDTRSIFKRSLTGLNSEFSFS